MARPARNSVKAPNAGLYNMKHLLHAETTTNMQCCPAVPPRRHGQPEARQQHITLGCTWSSPVSHSMHKKLEYHAGDRGRLRHQQTAVQLCHPQSNYRNESDLRSKLISFLAVHSSAKLHNEIGNDVCRQSLDLVVNALSTRKPS